MKISRIATAIICMGVLAMLASDAIAQGGGRRGGGGRGFGGGGVVNAGGSVMSMMGNDKLKEELELEDEQVTKIKEFNDDARAMLQEKMQEMRDSGDFSAIREAITELREEQNESEKEFASEVFSENSLNDTTNCAFKAWAPMR